MTSPAVPVRCGTLRLLRGGQDGALVAAFENMPALSLGRFMAMHENLCYTNIRTLPSGIFAADLNSHVRRLHAFADPTLPLNEVNILVREILHVLHVPSHALVFTLVLDAAARLLRAHVAPPDAADLQPSLCAEARIGQRPRPDLKDCAWALMKQTFDDARGKDMFETLLVSRSEPRISQGCASNFVAQDDESGEWYSAPAGKALSGTVCRAALHVLDEMGEKVRNDMPHVRMRARRAFVTSCIRGVCAVSMVRFVGDTLDQVPDWHLPGDDDVIERIRAGVNRILEQSAVDISCAAGVAFMYIQWNHAPVAPLVRPTLHGVGMGERSSALKTRSAAQEGFHDNSHSYRLQQR